MRRFSCLPLLLALLAFASSPAVGQSYHESAPVLDQVEYNSADVVDPRVDGSPAPAPVKIRPTPAASQAELAGAAALYVEVELIYARYAAQLRGAETPAENAGLLVERTGELMQAVEEASLPNEHSERILNAARESASFSGSRSTWTTAGSGQ
jgi:hypothetical protein